MRRLSTELPFTCVTCEVEIVGPPTFHVGLPFCCAGCVADGPCVCSYDAIAPLDVRAVRYCLDLGEASPVASPELVGAAGRRA